MAQTNQHALEWKPAIIPAIICLAINLAIFVGVAANRPEYLRDYRLNTNPDAPGYVLRGRNLLLHGAFSCRSEAPYLPDMLRTPVYPLFAGVLHLVGGAPAIYVTQALLQACSSVLVYHLVRPHFGATAAFVASAFLGTDQMLAVSNFETMSEPLFVFLVLASASCLLGSRPSPPRGHGRSWFLPTAALLTGLSILTRPAALYLPLVYVGMPLWLGVRDKQILSGVKRATLFLSLAYLPVGLWVARNYHVFSVARLTTVDANNLVYFVGAGAYQVEHGVTLEEAQEMIAEEYRLVPYAIAQNHSFAPRPVSEMDAELRAVWPMVVFKYPRALGESSLKGILKASISHNVALLAELTGREWIAPGTSSLLGCDPAAFQRLCQNGPLLVTAFIWQVLHVCLALLGASFGLSLLLSKANSERFLGPLFLAVLAYFYLTVALFGCDAFWRCRAPVLPFLYIFAGAGVVCLIGVCKRILAVLCPRAAT